MANTLYGRPVYYGWWNFHSQWYGGNLPPCKHCFAYDAEYRALVRSLFGWAAEFSDPWQAFSR